MHTVHTIINKLGTSLAQQSPELQLIRLSGPNIHQHISEIGFL